MTTHPSGLGEPRGPGFLPAEGLAQPIDEAAVPGQTRPRRATWPAGVGRGLLVLAVSAATGAVAGHHAGGQDDAAVTFQQAAPPVTGSPAPGGDLVAAAEAVRQGVVSVQVSSGRRTGTGSGFVLDDRAHILTNNHVVAGGGTVTVTGADGRSRTAEVVGRDQGNDIAVLRVAADAGLRPLVLGRSADVRVGEQVLAIGSPLGLSGTVTSGIVSAVDRQARIGGTLQPAVQTDASINPGNSGGPLVNLRGEVVGVNTAIATLEGGGSIGVGFAIPIDRAAQVAGRLISGR